jgi:hypothetical protein
VVRVLRPSTCCAADNSAVIGAARAKAEIMKLRKETMIAEYVWDLDKPDEDDG